jgi:tRNA A-37 threonylcarbamoyl transferase component Bud32
MRLATDASAPPRTTAELQRRLQLRLRIICFIMGGATASLAAFATYVRRENLRADPSRFWTEPPLPGVLFLVAVIGAALAIYLSPARRPSLRRLRAIEWASITLTAAFFVVNQTRAMADLFPGLLGKPMELGVAQGAPWGVLILAYAVLIPSSLRYCGWRTGAIAACAFLPDLAILATGGPYDQVVSYIALKIFIIAVMSALALYGSYRIEELGQEAEVARELGQYLLRQVLGEGGMGTVYFAEHRLLRRPCAVKLIRAEQASDEVALARFEREVQSAAALTHPNTVQIYDYGRSEDGTFYFAMEFLPGISLDELVERYGPVEPARAVHVLSQLCGALQEAHHRGLVHRDLKPGNVMLCERGGVPDVAKLLDFGLVAAMHDENVDQRITQAGMVVGTPAFMSPEQCMGDADITPASDIYSLGALGYFLLTGAPPFSGRTAMQTIMAHVNEVPRRVTEVRPEVPAALSDVIAKCLNKQPADRFADAESLEHALAYALASDSARWNSAEARAWWNTRTRA